MATCSGEHPNNYNLYLMGAPAQRPAGPTRELDRIVFTAFSQKTDHTGPRGHDGNRRPGRHEKDLQDEDENTTTAVRHTVVIRGIVALTPAE